MQDKVFTPDGEGFVTAKDVVRGKVSYCVSGDAFEGWYSENQITFAPKISYEFGNIRDAAWKDVRNKAKRLRSEGAVNIYYFASNEIQATVQGDNGVYEVEIHRKNASGEGVTWWSCSCFIEGTLVTMSDGSVKPIEDVKENDLVRTGSGDSGRVSRVFKNRYSDTLYGVKLSGYGEQERIWATKDHPWYSTSVVRCKKCSDRKKSPDKCTHIVRSSSYIESRNLTTESYLQVPKAQVSVESVILDITDHMKRFIELNDGTVQSCYVTSTGKIVPVGTPINRFIKVDEDFAYLLGLFIGDGNYHKDGAINLTFGPKEERLALRSAEIFKSKFGITASTKLRTSRGSSTWHVGAYSNSVVSLFRSLVGSYSHSKKLCRELTTLDIQTSKSLLKGYFDSDGCYGTNGTSTITSINRTLISQFQEILLRMGVTSSVGSVTAESQSNDLVGYNARVAYKLSWRPYSTYSNSKRFLEDGNQWTKIESIQTKDFDGWVYNFEVEGEHTYLVHGIHVHNCEWGAHAWNRVTYLGRQCAHSLASYYEMQAMSNKSMPSYSSSFDSSHSFDTLAFIAWVSDNNIEIIFVDQIADALNEFNSINSTNVDIEDVLEYIYDEKNDVIFEGPKVASSSLEYEKADEFINWLIQRKIISSSDEISAFDTRTIRGMITQYNKSENTTFTSDQINQMLSRFHQYSPTDVLSDSKKDFDGNLYVKKSSFQKSSGKEMTAREKQELIDEEGEASQLPFLNLSNTFYV